MGFQLTFLRRRIFGVIPAQHRHQYGGQGYPRVRQRAGYVRRSHPSAGKLRGGGVVNAHQTAEKKNNFAVAGEGMKIHFVKRDAGQQYPLDKQDLAKNQPDVMDNAPYYNHAGKNSACDKGENN